MFCSVDSLFLRDRFAFGVFDRLTRVVLLLDLDLRRLDRAWLWCNGLKFWIIPWETRKTAKTTQIGISR